MTRSRIIIKDLLANAAAFLLFFNVVSVIYFFTHYVAEYVFWVIAVPFFIMYILRRTVSKIHIFVITHLVLVAVFGLLFGDIYSRWFVFGFAAAAGVYSFLIKSSRERVLTVSVMVFQLAVYAALFLLLTVAEGAGDAVQVQLIFTCLVAMGINILYIQMDALDYRLTIVTKIDGIHELSDSVLASNNRLVLFFIGFFSLAGAFLAFFPIGIGAVIGVAMNIVAGYFVRVWHSIIYLFTTAIEFFLPYADNYERNQWEADFHSDLYLDGYLHGYWEMDATVEGAEGYDVEALFEQLMHVYNIIGPIFFFAIAAIVCWLFYKFFNRNRYHSGGENPDDETIVHLDRTVLKDLRSFFPRLRTKPKNPIRRAYYKKIRSYIRAGADLSNNDTPDAMAEKLRQIENLDNLTEMYKKERYS